MTAREPRLEVRAHFIRGGVVIGPTARRSRLFLDLRLTPGIFLRRTSTIMSGFVLAGGGQLQIVCPALDVRRTRTGLRFGFPLGWSARARGAAQAAGAPSRWSRRRRGSAFWRCFPWRLPTSTPEQASICRHCARIPSHDITHREKHSEQNHDDEEHAEQLAVTQDQLEFTVFIFGQGNFLR